MNGSIFENGKKNDSGKNFQDHNSQISLVKKIFVLQVPCGLHSKWMYLYAHDMKYFTSVLHFINCVPIN